MKPNGSQDIAVDIPFSGGMGEGAAPFVFNGPLVELAEDCVITKEGAYKRIPGGELVTTLAGITGGSRGLSLFDSTLVQHTTDGPHQFNETLSAWRASNIKGFVPTQPRSDIIVSQTDRSVFNTQVAVSTSGYELYAWDEYYPSDPDGTFYGSGWTGKGLAIRDPDGGWTITPATVSGFGSQPGHQIIAIGETFLIGFTNASGFQCYKIASTATSASASVQIITNATGASVTSTYQYSSLHDVCLSTDGLSAYFLVAGYAAGNYYIYTVTAAGQTGTASNGANAGGSAWAIAVDNAKVYVAESQAGVDTVRMSKVAEASISAGTAATAIGSLTVSGRTPYRVRMCGANNTGVYVAVEALTEAQTTDLALEGDPPAAPPSYNQLPSAPYVEVGLLPTSDVIGSYTAINLRAYAHGYVLGTGIEYVANRGPQLLVVYHGLFKTGKAWTDADGATGAFTYNYALWTQAESSGPYRGGVWLEVCDQLISDGQGGTVTQYVMRSLGRVAWDTAKSGWEIGLFTGDPVSTPRNIIIYDRGSISRSVGRKFAVEAVLDNVTCALRRCTVDIAPKPPISFPAHGDMYLDGACQHVWDGQHSFENTPHFPPIIGWVPATATYGDPYLIPQPTPIAITMCAAGYVDTWSFYWEWSDANGYLHRSAVSSYTITLSGFTTGGSYHYATPGQCPGWFGVLPPLSANDSTVFRNLRLVSSYLAGTGTTTQTTLLSKWSIDWTAIRGDFVGLKSTTNGRTILPSDSGYIYTDGGVLEAQAPPSPASLTSTRDRLWLISTDNRRQLYYTKPLEALIAPEFNSALTVDIPADAGEGIVVLTIDDKPVVLCEKGLYFIAGDGPNALGTQGSFAPQVIQSDTGCVDKNSTARCDYGAFFQGERGIYLLDRGLNVSLVSQGVQDRATSDISKAVAVPKEQQIRFGLTAGDILVYHYALKAWTVINKTAYDAVVWDGYYTRVYDSANMYIVNSDGSSNLDAESNINMRIKTAWIKADKLQGFARFKRVQLLHSQQGGAYAYGPITVNAYFNYEDAVTSYTETATWTSAQRIPVAVRSQIELRLNKQKSESIKLDIQCPNLQAAGEGYDYFAPIALEGISLVVGTITSTQFRHLKQATRN